MRTGSNWVVWLEQGNPTRDSSLLQIEFGNARQIPQAAPGTTAIAGCDHCVWKGRGKRWIYTQVKALEHTAILGVEQDHVVGEVVGYKQEIGAELALLLSWDDGDAGGIGDGCTRFGFLYSGCDPLALGDFLRLDFNKTLRCNFAFVEGVHSDSVPRIAWAFSFWVCDGTHGRVEVGAIAAECQADEVALVGIFGEAGVGEICDLV